MELNFFFLFSLFFLLVTSPPSQSCTQSPADFMPSASPRSNTTYSPILLTATSFLLPTIYQFLLPYNPLYPFGSSSASSIFRYFPPFPLEFSETTATPPPGTSIPLTRTALFWSRATISLLETFGFAWTP